MKRKLALILVLLTFIIGTVPSFSIAANATSSQAKAAPVKITWFWREGNNSVVPQDGYVAKKILKDLNIKYVHIDSRGMAPNERLQMLIAAGDVPDVMESFYGQTTSFIGYGIVIPVEKYLTSKYLNNVITKQTNFTAAMNIEKRADGHIYAIPATMPRTIAEVTYIRYDWLKNLNLPVPSTMEELKNTLIAFGTKDPDKNGKADTYGTLFNNNAWSSLYDLNLGCGGSAGSWVKDGKGSIEYVAFLPRAVNSIKWMKSVIDAGGADKEIADTDPKRTQNFVLSGKIGFVAGYFNTLDQENLLKTDPKADWRPMPPPKAFYSKGYTNSSGILRNEYIVSSTCKNVEAVMKLMNYMADDGSTPDKLNFSAPYWEAGYGKRGVNWDVTKDGKFDFSGTYIKRFYAQNRIDTWVGVSRRFRTVSDFVARQSGLNAYQLKCLLTENSYPTETELYGNANYPIVEEGLELPDTVYKFINQVGSTVWATYKLQAILGKVDIDKGFTKMVKDAKQLGYDQAKKDALAVFKKAGKLK
jgi:ABC-type glycerol-3-phosphate transport system substrate-binding protein